MLAHIYVLIYAFLLASVARSATVSTRSQCTPFHSTFSTSDVSNSEGRAPFIAVSPPGSYKVDQTGLELYLQKPPGKITTKGGVNNVVAEGATVNSTFTLLFVHTYPRKL